MGFTSRATTLFSGVLAILSIAALLAGAITPMLTPLLFQIGYLITALLLGFTGLSWITETDV